MTHEQHGRDCEPLRGVLARVGDRWTIVILMALAGRRLRFKDLHRAVGGISQRMLTVTLRNLERDGLVERIAYPTVPPRVDYELSDRGHSLKDALAPVAAWAAAHRDGIAESRRRFDGKALAAAAPTLIRW
ncbi:MAG TPA: helix-turn-helix domain-containing protein [Roseomonas sp.]